MYVKWHQVLFAGIDLDSHEEQPYQVECGFFLDIVILSRSKPNCKIMKSEYGTRLDPILRNGTISKQHMRKNPGVCVLASRRTKGAPLVAQDL